MADDRLSADEVALWRGFLAWTEDVTAQAEQALTAATGLSAAEFQILTRLSEAGGTVQQQVLQTALRWSATRISHQLARMQNRGQLTRSSSGAGRAMTVTLTEHGADVLLGARAPHARAVRQRFLDTLSEAQRAALGEVTARYRDTLPPGSGARAASDASGGR